jgi:flagellar motor switch/type III secretory pathway protein FliN
MSAARMQRVKPFPVNRLARLRRAELELLERLEPAAWLPAVEGVADELARRIGLGGAALELARVEALRTEAVRADWAGSWRFAVFADPVAGRQGFLALDPLLLGRLQACLASGRQALPGAGELASGDRGRLAALLCAGLVELGEIDRGWSGWRYLGLLESAGALGRSLGDARWLLGCWLKLQPGWDAGFAVWLEPERSLQRRRPDRGTPPPVALWLGQLEVSAARLLGSSRLGLDELRALAAGDVVLLQQVTPDDRLVLRAGRLRLDAVAAGHGWRIEGIERRPEGADMADEDIVKVAATDEAPVAAEELPVTLTAEAGRVDLTVGQLSGLRAGDVLTLPDALLGPVALRAGERLVARGELVDVEGRRGVRLLEIGAAGGGDAAAA